MAIKFERLSSLIGFDYAVKEVDDFFHEEFKEYSPRIYEGYFSISWVVWYLLGGSIIKKFKEKFGIDIREMVLPAEIILQDNNFFGLNPVFSEEVFPEGDNNKDGGVWQFTIYGKSTGGQDYFSTLKIPKNLKRAEDETIIFYGPKETQKQRFALTTPITPDWIDGFLQYYGNGMILCRSYLRVYSQFPGVTYGTKTSMVDCLNHYYKDFTSAQFLI